MRERFHILSFLDYDCSDEAKSNQYTLFYLCITCFVNLFLWLLNILGIFIVDSSIFQWAVLTNCILTLASVAVLRIFGHSNPRTKYLLLFMAVFIYATLNAALTYHVTLSLVFPIIYAAQYREKRVILHTYALSAISIFVSLYIGINYGLVDANMILLTSSTTSNFLKQFPMDAPQIPSMVTIFLFFGFVRCMVLLAVVPVVYYISNALEDKTRLANEAIRKHADVQSHLVLSLSTIIASRDTTTGEHIKNSSRYTAWILNKLLDENVFPEMTDNYAYCVSRGAVLHDVGKLKVPDAILCKEGKLTDEEYTEMKRHTIYGAEMMSQILSGIDDADGYLTVATQMALSHHERWDGTGYPLGVSGEDIPLCARVMAVADVLDALLSKRQYKDAFSYDEVYNIMKDEADKQFDARILNVLLDNWDEFKNFKVSGQDSNLSDRLNHLKD